MPRSGQQDVALVASKGFGRAQTGSRRCRTAQSTGLGIRFTRRSFSRSDRSVLNSVSAGRANELGAVADGSDSGDSEGTLARLTSLSWRVECTPSGVAHWKTVAGVLASGVLVIVVGCETRNASERSQGGEYKPIVPPLTRALTEVIRAPRHPSTPLEDAPLVIVGRVRERRDIEVLPIDNGDVGGSLMPPASWAAITVWPIHLVRVNEREAGDPDLSRGSAVIEQHDLSRPQIRFEFGRYYLLLLRPALEGPPPIARQFDRYVFSLAQGGFEIRHGRLWPLAAGGPLDAFRGRDANEVIAQFRR
jgi:hypothetical protein